MTSDDGTKLQWFEKDPKKHTRKNPFIAALLSLLLPGLGWIYIGRRSKGIWMVCVDILWVTVPRHLETASTGYLVAGVATAIWAYINADDLNTFIQTRDAVSPAPVTSVAPDKPMETNKEDIVGHLARGHEFLQKGILTPQEYEARKVHLLSEIGTSKPNTSTADAMLLALGEMREKGAISQQEFDDTKKRLLT